MTERFVNGRLTSREQLMGISVGSAGGWSLEVYPGNFVVHRKYGFGRYERTLLHRTIMNLLEMMMMTR